MKIRWQLYQHNHHHHVMLSAHISLTLFRHPSLSSIASGTSSGLHPGMTTTSPCIQKTTLVVATEVSRKILHPDPPKKSPCATLAHKVGRATNTPVQAIQLLFCGMLFVALLCNFCLAFSLYTKSASMWCIHIVELTWLLLWKNCILYYRIGLTSVWSITYQ